MEKNIFRVFSEKFERKYLDFENLWLNLRARQ